MALSLLYKDLYDVKSHIVTDRLTDENTQIFIFHFSEGVLA